MIGSGVIHTKTITAGSVGCSLIAQLATGTIQSGSATVLDRLRISGGTTSQTYTDLNGDVHSVVIRPGTFIIIAGAGPVMTTQMIRVKSTPSPDSLILDRPTSAPIAALTRFYFCDPAMMNGYTFTQIINTAAPSSTFVDQFGGVFTLIGGASQDFGSQMDNSPVPPVMINAVGNVQVTNWGVTR